MKLAIFGATGGTGKQLVEQALAAGHQVVAFVRDPSRLTTRHERLMIIQGELADQAAIEHAVLGADAVISALGPRRGVKDKSITRGTENILAAMNKHGVRRVVVTSTPSARDPNDVPDFKFKFAVRMIQWMARGAYEDIVNAGLKQMGVPLPMFFGWVVALLETVGAVLLSSAWARAFWRWGS